MAKSKPKVWVYTVPNEKGRISGWGRAFLTEDGMFTSMSDYDDYAYWWTATGDDNFRAWFCRTFRHDPDYIQEKFGYGREKQYNGKKTYEGIKQYVEETMERDEQENILGEIEGKYNYLRNDDDFKEWIENGEFALHDFTEFASYGHDAQLRGYMEHVLPRLVELIEAELKEEEVATLGSTP